MTIYNTPQEIECLKGNMLLTLAGLKTRFVGSTNVPVKPGDLHFLTSEFTQPDGTKTKEHIPIVVLHVEKPKARAELTAKELNEAGYRDLADLRERVTLDKSYEQYVINTFGADHPTDPASLEVYPGCNFTYELPSPTTVKGTTVADQMKHTYAALQTVRDKNSMPASYKFAEEFHGMDADEIDNVINKAIVNVRSNRAPYEAERKIG